MEQNNRDKAKNRKPVIDFSIYGKIPPQALDLERAVIGGLMIDKNAFDIVAAILKKECFYADVHQRIFKAITDLAYANSPIDMLTVIDQLKKNEDMDHVGGSIVVIQLTRDVTETGSLEFYSRIIFQKFIQREVIRISGELINEAYEDSTDSFELLDAAENSFSKLIISKSATPYKSLQQVAENALLYIEERRHSHSSLTGVPSGIQELDGITQGWQPADLILIAARPAIGKSAIAANIAISAAMSAEKPSPVGMFLLEMAAIQYVMRMLAAQSMIERYKMKNGEITDQQMRQLEKIVTDVFSKTKILFDDTSSLDIYQLKAKARRMVLKEGVKLIIIDYLQLMNGNKQRNETREQEVSKISRELKQLAKELNVPIIALSQLTRQGDGDPKLTHLRESGSLEQDTDMVIFLVPPSEDHIKNNASEKDTIWLKIAKNRDGVCEEIPVKFVKEIQKIMTDLEYNDYLFRKEQKGQGRMSFEEAENNLRNRVIDSPF